MKKLDTGHRLDNFIPDNFVVITEFVSPIQQQLLEQRILLANTPADADDHAGLARKMRDLHLFERLAENERAEHPHYAVTRLVAQEAKTGVGIDIKAGMEAEDNDDDNRPNPPPGLGSRLSHLFGLDTLLGDLSEERLDKAATSGKRAANWWFCEQVLASISPMIWNAARSVVKSVTRAAVK